MRKIDLKKTLLNNKKIVILMSFIFIVLIGLLFNKIISIDNYKDEIKVAKVSMKRLTANAAEITNDIKSFDKITYNIKYTLKGKNGESATNRTAIITADITEDNLKYASWNLSTEKNVTSEIINDGKTLKLTITAIDTDKEYTTPITLSITGAPNGYSFNPTINVNESTNTETAESTNTTTKVSTLSISGVAIDSETKEQLSNVELLLCKVQEDNTCKTVTTIFTKEDGSYVFGDLEDGTYKVSLVNNSEYETSESDNIVITNESKIFNINLLNNGEFHAKVDKYVKKIEVTENGEKKSYDYNNLNKAVLAVKNIKNVEAKITYEFTIINIGSKEGFVKVVKEDIPEGLIFNKEYEENKNWIEENGILYNKTLSDAKLKVGESKVLTITLDLKNQQEAKTYLNKVIITGESYHTVVFVGDDKIIKQQEVLDSDKINSISTSKEGYTFDGWYTDISYKTKFDFNSPILKDTAIYAKLTKNAVYYNITFIDEGKDYYKTKTEEGKPITDIPTNPSKEGYTFTGWSTDSTCKGEKYDFNTPTKLDLTFYSCYEKNKEDAKIYTAIFKDPEGNTYDEYTQSIIEGGTISKPELDPILQCKDFDHWSETKNGEPYNFNEILTGDKVLYAVFSDSKITLTYKHYDSETNEEIKWYETSITCGSKPDTPSKNPTEPGKEFDKWIEPDGTPLDPDDIITEDKDYTSTFKDIALPLITHKPTEWTKNSVIVSMSIPDTMNIVNADGEDEVLIIDKSKYSLEYSIDNGEYVSYEKEFIINENCNIKGRLSIVKTGEKGNPTIHPITNIDKINPNIISMSSSNLTQIGFNLNMKVRDNESGIGTIKIYKDDNLEKTYTYSTLSQEEANQEILESYTFEELFASTTYKIYIEVYDRVENLVTSEEMDVTTNAADLYIAQIIGRNDTLFEEADYEKYQSLHDAIESCGDAQCTIQMLDNTTESNTIGENQNITIDLNSKSISSDDTQTLLNNGQLIVIDNSEDGLGNISNTTSIAINNIGTFTLGNNDETVSITAPVIEGITYGLKTTGTFNFYDGKIIGKVAIFGKVNATPINYSSKIDTGDQQEATLAVLTDPEAKIGSVYYLKLQTAIDQTNIPTIENNSVDTVVVLKDITLTKTINIAKNQNFILDLNDCNLSNTLSNTSSINNEGNLEIINSLYDAENEFSIIASSSDGIVNNGTLNLSNVHVFTTSLNSDNYSIKNNSNLSIENCIIGQELKAQNGVINGNINYDYVSGKSVYNSANAITHVKSGVFYSDFTNENGTVNINDGTYGSINNNGNMTINDALVSKTIDDSWGEGKINNGEKGTLNILHATVEGNVENSGNFTIEQGRYYGYIENNNSGILTINDGTYGNTYRAGVEITNNDNGTLNINGGTMENPLEYDDLVVYAIGQYSTNSFIIQNFTIIGNIHAANGKLSMINSTINSGDIHAGKDSSILLEDNVYYNNNVFATSNSFMDINNGTFNGEFNIDNSSSTINMDNTIINKIFAKTEDGTNFNIKNSNIYQIIQSRLDSQSQSTFSSDINTTLSMLSTSVSGITRWFGNLNVENSSVNSIYNCLDKYKPIRNEIIQIKDSNVKNEIEFTTDPKYLSTLKILGKTIIGNGIHDSEVNLGSLIGGNVIIGDKDSEYNENYPIITSGSNPGIETPGYTYFYDGQIYGYNYSFYGKFKELREGMNFMETTGIPPEQKFVLRKGVLVNDYEAQIGDVKYKTLKDAIDSVNNISNDTSDSIPTKINILRNVYLLNPLEINANQNIIIEISDDYNINLFRNEFVIRNNGILQLIGGHYLNSNDMNSVIENNNVLILGDVTKAVKSYPYIASYDGTQPNYGIINNGSLEFNSGTVVGKKLAIFGNEPIVRKKYMLYQDTNEKYAASLSRPSILSMDIYDVEYGENVLKTHLYQTIASAISEQTNSKKTILDPTLTLTRNGASYDDESQIVIPIGYTYTLDLNGFDYILEKPIINNGSLIIKNGNIKVKSDTGIINNGNLELNSGTYSSENSTSTIIENKGTLDINNNASINGEINGIAIDNTGILNLGENDGSILLDSPVITGTIKNNKIFNYYDGIISALEPISGLEPNLPENYATKTNVNSETLVKTTLLDSVLKFEVMSDETFFQTIEEALSYVIRNNLTNEVIKFLDNATYTSSFESILIPNGFNITFDLNKFTINNDKDKLIINEGNFKISNGTITSTSTTTIENDNEMIMDTGLFESNGDDSTFIKNSGELTLTNSNIFGSQYAIDNDTNSILTINSGIYGLSSMGINSQIAINNNGTLNILNGTLYSINETIKNNELGSVTMTNGTLYSSGNAVSNDGSFTLIAATLKSDQNIINNPTGILTYSATTNSTPTFNIENSGTATVNGGFAYINNTENGDFTINNISAYGLKKSILNSGTMKFVGGQVSTSYATKISSIINNRTGTLSITGGTITSYTKVLENLGGTINLAGGTLNASQKDNKYVLSTYGIYNDNGIVSITGGTINSSVVTSYKLYDNESLPSSIANTDNAYGIYNYGEKSIINMNSGTINTQSVVENYKCSSSSCNKYVYTAFEGNLSVRLYNDGGTINVKDFTVGYSTVSIGSTVISSNSPSGINKSIYNKVGILNINDFSAEKGFGFDNYGTMNVNNSTINDNITNSGTLNLGINDDTINPDLPIINYPIANNDTLNFYDGRIYGYSTGNVINGNKANVPLGYSVLVELDSEKNVMVGYLATAIDTVEDTTSGIKYSDFDIAINYLSQNNLQNHTLKMLCVVQDLPTITIPKNLNVTIDLNNLTLELDNTFVINEGILNIANGNSTSVTSNTDKAFINKGTMNLTGGEYTLSKDNSILVENCEKGILNVGKINAYITGKKSIFIQNDGTTTFNDSSLYIFLSGINSKGIINNELLNIEQMNEIYLNQFYTIAIVNSGTVNYNAGELYSGIFASGCHGVINNANSNFYMNGGRMRIEAYNEEYNYAEYNEYGNLQKDEASGIDNYGKVYINGGKIYAASSSTRDTSEYDVTSYGIYNYLGGYIEMNNENSVISSSTYTDNKNWTNYECLNQVENVSYGIYDSKNNSNNVVINNGTIEKNNKYGCGTDTYGIMAKNAIINGGTIFRADISENLSVNGGVFDYLYLNNANSLSFKNAIINKTLTLKMHYYDSIANVLSGTIGNIILTSGTLNYGIDDGAVNMTSPAVNIATGIGISIGNSAILNYYDGSVTALTPLSRNPDKVASGYEKNQYVNLDGTTTYNLKLSGAVDKVFMLNGSNYQTLSEAIGSMQESGTYDLVLYRDYTLNENDTTIPSGITINLYTNGYTFSYGDNTISGDGTFNLINGEVPSGLLASIKTLLNIDDGNYVRKNIILSMMDNGENLSAANTYKLQVLDENKFEDVSIKEDINDVGRYTIDLDSKTYDMKTINGKLYLNKMPAGDYKLIDNNKNELIFKINDDGKLSGNIKENYKTSEDTSTMSSATAQVMTAIQTGVTVRNYFLIFLTSILGFVALILINRKIEREQQ